MSLASPIPLVEGGLLEAINLHHHLPDPSLPPTYHLLFFWHRWLFDGELSGCLHTVHLPDFFRHDEQHDHPEHQDVIFFDPLPLLFGEILPPPFLVFMPTPQGSWSPLFFTERPVPQDAPCTAIGSTHDHLQPTFECQAQQRRECFALRQHVPLGVSETVHLEDQTLVSPHFMKGTSERVPFVFTCIKMQNEAFFSPLLPLSSIATHGNIICWWFEDLLPQIFWDFPEGWVLLQDPL